MRLTSDILCVYFTQNVKSSNTVEEVEINKKISFVIRNLVVYLCIVKK